VGTNSYEAPAATLNVEEIELEVPLEVAKKIKGRLIHGE